MSKDKDLTFIKSGYESWECPVCKKSGKTKFDRGSLATEVLQSMLDDHLKLSPKCHKDSPVLKNKDLGHFLSLLGS